MFRSVLLRFVLPVAFASCVVAYFGLPYIERLLAEWFRSDVELRAQLVMHSMRGAAAGARGARATRPRLRAYLAKVTADERLLAILVCRPDGTMMFKTERAPSAITCDEKRQENPRSARIVQLPSGSVQVSRFDFDAADRRRIRVLMLHDLSFVDRRQRTARDFVLVFIGISMLLLALLGGAGRVAAAATLGQRADRRHPRQAISRQCPIAALLAADPVPGTAGAGARSEEKQRLEIDFRENWTPQALQQVVRDHLHSSQVIIVSNREPYIHNFDADHRPVVQVPASGMVTALEPIMRACSGTWVAHGAGTRRSRNRGPVRSHPRAAR